MATLRFWTIHLVFLVSSAALSQPQPDWDPASKIPEFVFVGEVTDYDRSDAQRLRQGLIEYLGYWKQVGLPNIPAVDAMVFIPQYKDQSIRDYLKILNPDIPDVMVHAQKQYQALQNSKIAAAMHVYAQVIGVSPIDLINQFFDSYAAMRYGYTGKGFVEDISMNKPLSRLEVEKDVGADNAYFSRSTKVDLEGTLAPLNQTSMTLDEAEEIIKGNSIPALVARVARSETTRIVILPRTAQKVFGPNVSTLKDISVIAHEIGHHINRAIISPFENHLMIEEALADYLAAAGLKNPKIGSFFAAVTSGDIQNLVVASTSGESAEKLQEAASIILSKSMIRSLDTMATMDSVPRVFAYQEEHDAGDPARRFLWQVRLGLKGQEAEFDRIVLRSIRAYAERPIVIATQTDALLSFRAKIMELRRFLKSFHQTMKAKIFLNRDLKISENMAVARLINQNDAQIELRRGKLRSIFRPFGLALRPKIPADYVIPEFFRVVYRESASLPAIQAVVKAEAEKAMNSSSFEVTLEDGSRELVFARNRLATLNPLARRRVQTLIRRQHMLLKQFLAGDQNNPDRELLENYGTTLQAIQEYERTGRTYRLFWPYPTVAIAKAVLKIEIANDAAKVSAKQGTANSTNSCAQWILK